MTKLNFLINKYKEINQKLINEHIFPAQLPPKERKIFYKIDNLIFKKKFNKEYRHQTKKKDRQLFLYIITLIKLLYKLFSKINMAKLVNDCNFDKSNSGNNFSFDGNCNFMFLLDLKNDLEMLLKGINNIVFKNKINNSINKKSRDNNSHSNNDNVLAKALKFLHQSEPNAKSFKKQRPSHNPNLPEF